MRNPSVFALQSALSLLSRSGAAIPLVLPDGVFGPETSAALIMFQRKNRLPPTGVADYATWTELFRQAQRVQTAPSNIIISFPTGGFYASGARGDLLYIVQSMLSTIANHFANIPTVNYTGILDDETAKALRVIQQTYDLSPTGALDQRTWDILSTLYNHSVGRIPASWSAAEARAQRGRT